MSLFHRDTQRLDENKKDKIEETEETEELTDINEQSKISSTEDSKKSGKMEEIYSTKDKHIKYKKQTPIEAEEEQKRKAEAKEKLVKGKAEISFESEKPVEDDVELEAELEEGTVVSDEIIGDLSEGGKIRGIYVQDIDDIDISLDSSDALKRYEKQVNAKPKHDSRNPLIKEKQSSVQTERKAPKTVAKVPVYQHESKVNKIRLKAGKFTEVVENEYDEYLKSNDPTVSQKPVPPHLLVEPKQSLIYTLNKMAQKRKDKQAQKDISAAHPKDDKKEQITKGPKPEKKTAVSNKQKINKPQPKPQEQERQIDYESNQDEKYVLHQTKDNIRKLTKRTVILSVIFVASLVLEIITRNREEQIFSSFMSSGWILYSLISLVLLVIAGIVSKEYFINGLKTLKHFSANADTALSVAYISVFIETIVSFFVPNDFVNGKNHLYGIIVIIALLCNTVGRLFMVQRVKKNFRFITSKSPAYATKIFNDEETARRILSGTTAQRPIIAYQHRTKFLSDFLKISYAPDPSEETTSKLTPITLVCSLFVTILYLIVFKDFVGSVCALSVMMCISIPFCSLLSGNIVLYFFSKKMLRHNAMVAGYPSVRQFCDSTAIIVKADELYPKDSVKLELLKPTAEYKVEENLLSAAVVLKEAQSPLRFVFDELLVENSHNLPKVESVMYEDKSGLVGWVDGERVLVGNKSLMDRYHITAEEHAIEARCRNENKQLTYIAVSGQLVCLLVTSYYPDKKVSAYLSRAAQNGLCLVVSTTEPNVSAQRITEDYNIFFRSVKVLPTGYANECNEAVSKVEETSRAYLATRGKFTSLCRAISGCIKIKSNIMIGLIIEVFGLMLGVLLCATMVLYSSVSSLSIVEIILYLLFWGISTVIAQLIQRP